MYRLSTAISQKVRDGNVLPLALAYLFCTFSCNYLPSPDYPNSFRKNRNNREFVPDPKFARVGEHLTALLTVRALSFSSNCLKILFELYSLRSLLAVDYCCRSELPVINDIIISCSTPSTFLQAYVCSGGVVLASQDTNTSTTTQFAVPKSANVGVELISNIEDAAAVIAQTVCPGCIATNTRNTKHGFKASLKLAGAACNV